MSNKEHKQITIKLLTFCQGLGLMMVLICACAADDSWREAGVGIFLGALIYFMAHKAEQYWYPEEFEDEENY